MKVCNNTGTSQCLSALLQHHAYFLLFKIASCLGLAVNLRKIVEVLKCRTRQELVDRFSSHKQKSREY